MMKKQILITSILYVLSATTPLTAHKNIKRFPSRAVDTGVTTPALAQMVINELALLHPPVVGDPDLIAERITAIDMRIILASALAQMSVGGHSNPYVGIKAQFFAIYKDFFIGHLPNRANIASFNNDLIMIDRSVDPILAADLITFNNTVFDWLDSPAALPALANELHHDITLYNAELGAISSPGVISTQLTRSNSHASWMAILHQMQRPENDTLRAILFDVYTPFFTGNTPDIEAMGGFNRLLNAPTYPVEPDLQTKLLNLNTHMIQWTETTKKKKNKAGLIAGLTVMGVAIVGIAGVMYWKRVPILARMSGFTPFRNWSEAQGGANPLDEDD